MSNNKRGRWTRTPPSGRGPVVTFIHIPSDLSRHLESRGDELREHQVTEVPPRAAQRVVIEGAGPVWLIAGSEHPWPEAQLRKAKAVWWSKTTDVPMISIDPGGRTHDRDQDRAQGDRLG